MRAASSSEQLHARLNCLFAIAVFFVSLAAYLLTVAPTVCFWDCGEYTATCHTLEIPHPPGNPFFIMLARVISMALFFVKDFGLRINLISVFSSALMAALIYLIIVRVFVGWMGVPDATWKRFVVYVAGTTGSLFAAFGSTVWFCSVEAEVNSPVLVPIALCTWLILVWAQSRDERRDRLLVLITYIAFLGIGIHMYSMITLGPLFLYVIIVDPGKRKDWRLWATGILMGLVIYDISWFLIAGSLAAVLTLAMSFVEAKQRRRWQLCFFIAIVGILGFSSHLYIPVRSALNPSIDEDHPVTYRAFEGYLDRKQYGSESMISRMFWRRGAWSRQFGIEGHMGFGGFLITQFFRFSPLDIQKNFLADGTLNGWGKLLIYLLPTAFVLFGMGFLFRKHRNNAVLLGVMLFMTTIALVLYMNFADGTRADRRSDHTAWVDHGSQGPEPVIQREVRVRDYFYIAGFMYFGMWIGIAAGGLLYLLYTNRRKLLRATVAPACTVLFAASPALPLAQNMPFETRHNDFAPFDYAYNMLMSCEKDGILFTNGDNDTFPLWALQEAYGIRRDVRIVNLSLLNTSWYIKQIKHFEPRVPISYTDAQIEKLKHGRNPYTEPTRFTLPQAGITVTLPASRELRVMRIQDVMVVNIVDATNWTKPIYMAVTVSEDNLMGLAPYLRMQGLVYRVMPHEVPENEKLDLARTIFLLDKVYRFTGLGDGSSPLTVTSERLVSNYAASFLQIALSLRKTLADRHAEIEKLEKTDAHGADAAALAEKKALYTDTLSLVLGKLNQCISLIPWDWRPRALRHELLISDNRFPEAEARMREALAIQPENAQYLQMLAQALDMQGKRKEATEVLRGALEKNSDSWDTYLSVAQAYAEAGEFDSAVAVMHDFEGNHPGDSRPQSMIDQVERIKNKK